MADTTPRRPLEGRHDRDPAHLDALLALSPQERRREQAATLATPPRRYGFDARVIFWLEDRLWGTARTLPKFWARELVARTPYQAWEQASYFATTVTGGQEALARSVYEHVVEYRAEQDNEQWHLLVLEEMMGDDGMEVSRLRYRFLPQVVAFGFYQFSFLLYAARRRASYRLNADIEDHAEHEYAHLVAEHPEWEGAPFRSSFSSTHYQSRADVLRQIGYDERIHKHESLARMEAP
jgi:hypothetical protein